MTISILTHCMHQPWVWTVSKIKISQLNQIKMSKNKLPKLFQEKTGYQNEGCAFGLKNSGAIAFGKFFLSEILASSTSVCEHPFHKMWGGSVATLLWWPSKFYPSKFFIWSVAFDRPAPQVNHSCWQRPDRLTFMSLWCWWQRIDLNQASCRGWSSRLAKKWRICYSLPPQAEAL